MDLARDFFDKVNHLQAEAWEKNERVLRVLGDAVAGSLADGGVLHLFGSGHSQILAAEMERRAGGLVPVSTIEDPAFGWAEQVPGYGARLFDRYAYRYDVRPGEFIVVISNSGKNASPLEVAWAARERGLQVVALTSVTMSSRVDSLHPSGKRLFEMAHHVLDNGGIPGDAALSLPDGEIRVGPTSTMTGALLLNLLHVEIIQGLVGRGVAPLPVYISQNLPQGAAHNREICHRYRHRIRRPI